ncbi:MAG: sulfatase/phosphatase domain-containing protein [Cyclobacteriaceae bacterium]
MATSLDLARVEKPDYVEFNSLMGMVRGEQEQGPYDAIYGGYIDWQRMIRKDGFKLIVYPKIEKVLLFDLGKDPKEMTDLATDPAYQDQVKLMFEQLIQLQKQLNDQLDLQPLYEKLGAS